MNWLKNLGAMPRNLLGLGLVVMLAVLMANMVFMPKQRQLSVTKADLAQVNAEVTIFQTKVKKLDQLLAENQRLKKLLNQQRQQLPEQQEVANLLKQVTDLGAQSGLIFKLWRPGAVAPAPSGLYQELPVQVEVTGGYHQVGIFFEQIAGLDRIVNISEVKIDRDPNGQGLLAKFTATAFAAPPPPEGAEGTDAKTPS